MRTFALDLRSVALLRIGIACLILWDLADRARFLRVHYTDDGIFPRSLIALDEGRVQWSLHLASGTVAGQAVLFLVAAVLAVMLLLGWRTRIVAVASWVLLVSLQNRAPALCYGADALLRALLFFGLFLPLETRFSLDARAGRSPRRPDEHRSVPAAAITLQVAALYVATGLLKLPDPSWKNLTAVFFAVNADHHATYLGLWLGRFLGATRALTLATLVLEISGPLFLFVPLARTPIRLALVAAFTMFHLGTALALHLGYFPFVSILAWLLFLPAAAWERLGVATRPGVDVDRRPLVAGVSAVAALLVAFANLASTLPGVRLPLAAVRVTRAVAMEQRWVMFARPMHDGWFVAPATLASGKQIDVLAHGGPVSFAKPAHVADQFPSMRWRKLLTDMTLSRPAALKNRRRFARNICASWNAGLARDDDGRMRSVDIDFLEQDDRVDGSESPVERVVLVHRDCDPEPGEDP